MRRRYTLIVPIVVVMVLLIVAIQPVMSSTQTTREPILGVETDLDVQEVSTDEMLATEKLWDAQAMRDAIPMPLPMLDETQDETQNDEYPTTELGAAGQGEFIPGGMPNADANSLAQAMYPAAWTMLEQGEDVWAEEEYAGEEMYGLSYPPPFTRYRGNYYNQTWKYYPLMTIGRLFFYIPGKGNYSCSASVAVGRAVWTAGHCVYTKGRGWHTNMVFVPGYRAGAAPYGQFTISTMSAPYGWTKHNYHAYDQAIVIARDRSGKKVSQWVGHLGFRYNASATQQFHAIGYPGNIDSSKYSIICVGTTSRRDFRSGPDPVGMGCDMTGGSSGGPWLIRYSPYAAGPLNYVNGLVSYGKSWRKKEFYSAYFGTAAKNLYYWGKTK
jgi:V8-like Glu-specific endopeptidase